MLNNWVFKNGFSATTCTSFPYAYRLMFNFLKKGIEQGRKHDDMVKGMVIISPQRDIHGNLRRYSWASATQLAKDMELLTSDGEINSRAMKKK